jgi:germination protein M
MLKQSAFRRIAITTLSLIIMLIIYLFPNSNADLEDNTTYINSIKYPIYLVDKNNYVARVNILKRGNSLKENVQSIINSLTKENPDTIYLPNNFFPTIPANTKIRELDIQNGILKIDFSKELLNTNDAEKMIESIIYSLTEFEEIDKIMIFVEGKRLIKLPNSNEILPILLDRGYGINKTIDITSFNNINKTTTYYMQKENDVSYYIPVTTIDNSQEEKVQVIIKNLKTSPINQTNLNSFLDSETALSNYEILENSISLSFNNNLITNMSNKALLEEVKYSIFLSLKDTYHVQSVLFELPELPLSVIN